MRHTFIDRYAYHESPIHTLDTAFKMKITFTALTLLLLCLPLLPGPIAFAAYFLYGTLIILLAVIARIPLGFLAVRSALVLPFSALIVLVNYSAGNFSALQMLETLFKSVASVFTLLLLASVTPFHQILKQLARWRTPKLIILTLSFMYRYFFLLRGEMEALEQAVNMRWGSMKGWHRIKIYSNIVGILLLRSFERAQIVYQAMQMRGFSGDLT